MLNGVTKLYIVLRIALQFSKSQLLRQRSPHPGFDELAETLSQSAYTCSELVPWVVKQVLNYFHGWSNRPAWEELHTIICIIYLCPLALLVM